MMNLVACRLFIILVVLVAVFGDIVPVVVAPDCDDNPDHGKGMR